MPMRDRNVPTPVMLVILLLSCLTLYQILSVSGSLKGAQEDIAQGKAERSKLAASQNNSVEQTQALIKQVEQLGAKPVVNKADIPPKVVEGPQGPEGQPGQTGAIGPQGPIGPVGPQGLPPSVAQVAQAVAVFCANGRCKGSPPTAAQVASAVSSYCAANGQCRGPAGSMGPAPTELQIASAVSSYCAQDSAPCRGPKGEQGEASTVPGPIGPQGPVGPEGPQGPAGLQCEAEYKPAAKVVLTPEHPDTGETIWTCVLAEG